MLKNHALFMKIMQKNMNHTKIQKIMKKHEIMLSGTPGRYKLNVVHRRYKLNVVHRRYKLKGLHRRYKLKGCT